MKTLLLLRHSEAEPESPFFKDFERELTPKGYTLASLLGKDLHSQGFMPDIVLASAAHRALTTAQLVAEQIGFDKDKIIADLNLHNAQAGTLVDTLKRQPDTADKILLVGHNMGISFLAEYLTGNIFMMHPCAAILLQCQFDNWAMLNQKTAKFLWQKG